ncbi:MAG: hypothetical protein ABJA67_07405 [Chthonomonadales bacterium]
MRKILWFVGCVLMLGVGSVVSAKADNGDDFSKGWNLRAGFFVPERQASRQAEGDLWFTIGGERDIKQLERYKVTMSVDYYGSGSLYNIPIKVNVVAVTNKLRYGAGAGVGISHDFEHGILGFTYHLMVGYNLGEGANPLALEFKYLVQSTSSALNGFSFTIGGHF